MIGASRVSKKKKNTHIAGPSDWKGRLLSAPYVTTGILNTHDDDDDDDDDDDGNGNGNGNDFMMMIILITMMMMFVMAMIMMAEL